MLSPPPLLLLLPPLLHVPGCRARPCQAQTLQICLARPSLLPLFSTAGATVQGYTLPKDTKAASAVNAAAGTWEITDAVAESQDEGKHHSIWQHLWGPTAAAGIWGIMESMAQCQEGGRYHSIWQYLLVLHSYGRLPGWG